MPINAPTLPPPPQQHLDRHFLQHGLQRPAAGGQESTSRSRSPRRAHGYNVQVVADLFRDLQPQRSRRCVPCFEHAKKVGAEALSLYTEDPARADQLRVRARIAWHKQWNCKGAGKQTECVHVCLNLLFTTRACHMLIWFCIYRITK